MPGRVEEHDPPVTGLVLGASGALGERFGGRRLEVIDREVEMKLLTADGVGPLRRDKPVDVPKPEAPVADLDHAVVLVGVGDLATQQGGPELADRLEAEGYDRFLPQGISESID